MEGFRNYTKEDLRDDPKDALGLIRRVVDNYLEEPELSKHECFQDDVKLALYLVNNLESIKENWEELDKLETPVWDELRYCIQDLGSIFLPQLKTGCAFLIQP